MRRSLTLALPLLVLSLVLYACGDTDDADEGATGDSEPRTVEIEMRDNEYAPASVSVEAGEEVRFVFNNAGTVRHDAFLGDEAAQEDHEMEMSGDMGGESHDMEETNAVTVEPGDTGELVHTFKAEEAVLIGCHEPGHYAQGMRIAIEVS